MPLISIITVVYNDDWALSKTLKSVYMQSFQDYEQIIIDGGSNDSTTSLVKFWQNAGLVGKYICEPDEGVYDAMNKGARYSQGEYLLFLNAGDVFYDDDVLERVATFLRTGQYDALIGWGELGDKLWASWVLSPAYRMASLGFCHQALFTRRSLCMSYPFDSRKFKTDSDVLQFADVISNSTKVKLLHDILAIRSADLGLSANPEKTRASIKDTFQKYYDLSEPKFEEILGFRRGNGNAESVLRLLRELSGDAKVHLALTVIDTLYTWQSKCIEEQEVVQLFNASLQVLYEFYNAEFAELIKELLEVQRAKASFCLNKKENRQKVNALSNKLGQEYRKHYASVSKDHLECDFIVSLTSFPARIPSLHLVIESLVNQSCKPKKIILNLGKDEIKERKWLPQKLLEFEKQGLEINFVESTKHQYDKFLHIWQEYKNMPIVIVDDDVLYPQKSLEYLWRKHQEYPNCVVANRAHLMSIEGDFLTPYSDWKKEVCIQEPSHNIFPTGAGGVLYPKNFFDAELVCNEDLIMKYAPYADDVWLKMCSYARGIKSVCSEMVSMESWYFRYTPTMKEGALHKANVDKSLNDIQLKNLRKLISKEMATLS